MGDASGAPTSEKEPASRRRYFFADFFFADFFFADFFFAGFFFFVGFLFALALASFSCSTRKLA